MKQKLTILVGLTVAALALAAAAVAGTVTATATVTGAGSLSLSHGATASISDTLDGTDQSATYSVPLTLADARGTGAGWNLTIAATTFSDGFGHTLAAGTVTGAAQACHAGGTCTAATSSGITYPLTVSGTAAKFFNASVNTGLGKVDVTPTVSVAVPGNTFAGTYTSTVTLVTATGP
jgi:hypothetical protein